MADLNRIVAEVLPVAEAWEFPLEGRSKDNIEESAQGFFWSVNESGQFTEYDAVLMLIIIDALFDTIDLTELIDNVQAHIRRVGATHEIKEHGRGEQK